MRDRCGAWPKRACLSFSSSARLIAFSSPFFFAFASSSLSSSSRSASSSSALFADAAPIELELHDYHEEFLAEKRAQFGLADQTAPLRCLDDGGVPERPDPCCGDVAPTERSPLRSPLLSV